MFADAMTVRGIYGVAAILLCHAAAQWTGAGYHFDVSAPNPNLDELPVTIGEWESSEVALAVGTADARGADASINRQYVNADSSIAATCPAP